MVCTKLNNLLSNRKLILVIILYLEHSAWFIALYNIVLIILYGYIYIYIYIYIYGFYKVIYLRDLQYTYII